MRKLVTTALEKVWGTPDTEPWYSNPERQKIGEVWFSASDTVPLLVKFLFTSDNLSVQVHPGDEYAQTHHNSPGKTEMWHVLRAERGAKVALGLRTPMTPQRFRESCLNGSVMELLNWMPAEPGDTFFSESGTVHAIGGGLVLCEVQQYSDITYRLYDYGRAGRELHLERGMEVANLDPCEGRRTPTRISDNRDLLAACRYFRTEKLTVRGEVRCASLSRGAIYVALSGRGRIGDKAFETGEAFEIPGGGPAFAIESEAAEFLTTEAPGS